MWDVVQPALPAAYTFSAWHGDGAAALQAFLGCTFAFNGLRRHFQLPAEYTDEKIIDTMIWKFVPLLEKGALMRRRDRVQMISSGKCRTGLEMRQRDHRSTAIIPSLRQS